MRHRLGRRLLLGFACACSLTIAACGTSQPPVVIDLDSPIKDPSAPTQQKVELNKSPR